TLLDAGFLFLQEAAQERNELVDVGFVGAAVASDWAMDFGRRLGSGRALGGGDRSMRTEFVRVACAFAPDRGVGADQDGTEDAGEREQGDRLLVGDWYPEGDCGR